MGIVVEGGRLAQAGMFLEFGLSLSISLAVLNLLPIPVLDGGQIAMSCLEAIFPRLTRLRVPLTLLGLFVLAVLMVYTRTGPTGRALAGEQPLSEQPQGEIDPSPATVESGYQLLSERGRICFRSSQK